jgi:hypothetical protein
VCAPPRSTAESAACSWARFERSTSPQIWIQTEETRWW